MFNCNENSQNPRVNKTNPPTLLGGEGVCIGVRSATPNTQITFNVYQLIYVNLTIFSATISLWGGRLKRFEPGSPGLCFCATLLLGARA